MKGRLGCAVIDPVDDVEVSRGVEEDVGVEFVGR